jgi:hypothetical protein
MANATAITVNALTANGAIIAPTAQILDTGTAAVVLKTAPLAETDRVILRVMNTAAATLTVSVAAGVDPPAFRSGIGGFTDTPVVITSGERVMGPFESAQFIQSDGTLQFTFTPTSGTITATFVCYRLPVVGA